MREKCSINQNEAKEKRKKQHTKGRKIFHNNMIGINLNKSSNTTTINRLITLIKILRLSNWINEKLKL